MGRGPGSDSLPRLFADAEAGEDSAERVLGLFLADQRAEGVSGGVQLGGDQFGIVQVRTAISRETNPPIKGVDGAFQGLAVLGHQGNGGVVEVNRPV